MPADRSLAKAALAISVVALVAGLTGAAIGLPGRGSVDANDLSKSAKRALRSPTAYALVVGPNEVREKYSRGITDSDVHVNNTAFCISRVGFQARHAQVTMVDDGAVAEEPHVILGDTTACGENNRGTAVTFGNLTYDEKFLIALYRK